MCVSIAFAVVLVGCDLDGSYSDAAVATIKNDTPHVVELRLCSDDACKDEFYPPHYELEPGESAGTNVSKRGVPNVYLVIDSQGRRTGCLPFVVTDSRPFAKVTASVSMQRACSDDLPTSWP